MHRQWGRWTPARGLLGSPQALPVYHWAWLSNFMQSLSSKDEFFFSWIRATSPSFWFMCTMPDVWGLWWCHWVLIPPTHGLSFHASEILNILGWLFFIAFCNLHFWFVFDCFLLANWANYCWPYRDGPVFLHLWLWREYVADHSSPSLGQYWCWTSFNQREESTADVACV